MPARSGGSLAPFPAGRSWWAAAALALALGATARASGNPWQPLWSRLRRDPSVQAAGLQLQAAQAALTAQESPVSLQLQASRDSFSYQSGGCPYPSNLAFLCQSGPAQEEQLGVSLVLTPYPYGSVADSIRSAELSLAQAHYAQRQAVVAAQVSAVTDLFQLHLAERNLQVALQGLQVAVASDRASRAEEKAGLITSLQLGQAGLSLAQARLAAEQAAQNLRLAKVDLSALIGHLRPPLPPFPPLPSPAPSSAQLQARISLDQAELQAAAALRSVLPVASLSYTDNFSKTSSLSLSLSSQTLQPTVSLTYANPSLPSQGTVPIQQQLQLALSVGLSGGALSALGAAKAQVQGAELQQRAADQQAAQQRYALQLADRQAQAELPLDRADLKQAEQFLAAARAQQQLGLTTPLAVSQAALAVSQARLSLSSAELSALKSRLALYQYFAVPLSEVLK